MPSKPKARILHWKPEVKPFSRPRDFSKFYNSWKWRKFSKWYRSKFPFCVECDSEGEVGSADVTDHKQGLGFILDNGLDLYDVDECQGLCSNHHNKKSGSERGRIRGKGSKT